MLPCIKIVIPINARTYRYTVYDYVTTVATFFSSVGKEFEVLWIVDCVAICELTD